MKQLERIKRRIPAERAGAAIWWLCMFDLSKIGVKEPGSYFLWTDGVGTEAYVASSTTSTIASVDQWAMCKSTILSLQVLSPIF